MEKHTESEKDTQLLCSVSAKKTRRGEEWADLGCSNIFYDSEGIASCLIALKDQSLVTPDKETK